MKTLDAINISGREALPLIEGGKGISISNWRSAGAWAATGGVGTVSCVNADSYDKAGNVIPQIYRGKTRSERHQELIKYGIEGGVDQVKRAWELSNGNGRLHINVLWEMGGAEPTLHGILERTKGLVSGVTCGAGMPYALAELVAQYGVYFHPIVSSARAFSALWKRAYHKYAALLGSVVYEDPWLAGGHNGLSNKEDPQAPQDPYPRVLELRTLLRKLGLDQLPIVMAGSVWYLRDWKDWINNSELGPIIFQFGSRPLLTKESPVSDEWKRVVSNLSEGDILLHRFSPTGFYSSAVKNSFIAGLTARDQRQVEYVREPDGDLTEAFDLGPRKKPLFVRPEDKARIEGWVSQGFSVPMRTPDSTVIFETPEKAAEIRTDQRDCMGCLSACLFSSWSQSETTTGRPADPRSFCIQKTLQDIAHGGPVDQNLMFAGHSAYHFSEDPFYSNGFIPTVKQLVDRIQTGD